MKLQMTVLVSVVASAACFQWAQANPVGQVGLVEGEVYVDQARIKKGAPVREGSIVEVKKGKATLILGKGNVFHLSSDSRMVVSKFDAKPDTKEESAQLDLKFGRTRALILNNGNEKKDLKIKARAATMGVRGTEIFIDAPRDTSRPINFFTLEGRADLKTNDVAPPVAVNQNQGVSTQATASNGGQGGDQNGGSQGSGEGKAAGGGGAPGQGSGPAPAAVAPPTMSLAEVKTEIKSQGMAPAVINTPQDMRRQVTQQYMTDQFGMGALPPLVLDPLQDRFTPVRVQPRFCDAFAGSCN